MICVNPPSDNQALVMVFIKSGCSLSSRSCTVVDESKFRHCCFSHSACLCKGQGCRALHFSSRKTQESNWPVSRVMETKVNSEVFNVLSLILNPPLGPFWEDKIPSLTSRFMTFPRKCRGIFNFSATSLSGTRWLLAPLAATYNTLRRE